MDQLETSDEAGVVRQAAAGSAEAFALVVRRHHAAVRWCLARYVRDPSTVDDLAQEVFLNAHQQLPDYRGTGSLRSWLLGITRNIAKQHLRTESRRRARETGPLAVQLAQWRLDRLETEQLEGEDQEQVFAVLRECIDRLPPESRWTVEEHYFRRQTLESIADRRGRSGGAVRMMLLRIRTALSKCIEGKLGIEV
jgi:RNA polymerase sigma-70 factor (ECF subfamily)